MIQHRSHARRGGFTLTEMLVAAALIIFMMWILSSAFEKGLTTFSQLKTAGDMQEKLRSAATVIRQDLISPHFDEGPEFVSGQRLDQSDWRPPAQGFFRIYQEGAAIPEGVDPDDPSRTLIHTRSPNIGSNSRGHLMQFTVKQKGDRRDRYFMIDTQDLGSATDGSGEGLLHKLSFPTYNMRRRTGIAPPGGGLPLPPEAPSSLFTTTWAEITYFIRPNGGSTGGVPLYSLYRRQNLLATELSGAISTQIPASDPRYLEVSAWPLGTPTSPVNSQKSITAPSRRFAVNQSGGPTVARAGQYQPTIPRLEDSPALATLPGDTSGQAQVASDLLLSDITDFEIKVLWDPAPASGAVAAAAAPTPIANPDYPFDQLPTGNNPQLASSRVFDTWSRNAASPGSNLDEYRQNVNPNPTGTAVEAWNGGYVSGTTVSERSIPLKIRVRAIQIELRIWDVKSKTSRQITIIQDL